MSRHQEQPIVTGRDLKLKSQAHQRRDLGSLGFTFIFFFFFSFIFFSLLFSSFPIVLEQIVFSFFFSSFYFLDLNVIV